MPKDKLDRSNADRAHSIARTVVASVPGAGLVLAPLFDEIVTAPLMKRRDEWLRDLDGRLEGIHQRVKNLEQMRDEGLFVSVTVQAMVAATKTHESAKRAALANAVIATALGQAPSEAKALMFVAYIDSFTQWHLAVLGYLADPSKWLTDRGIPIKSFMAGSRREPFKDAFPELPEELGNQILRDLYTRGLIQSESLGGMVTGPSVYQSLITAHGREFLQFVSAPEGEFH